MMKGSSGLRFSTLSKNECVSVWINFSSKLENIQLELQYLYTKVRDLIISAPCQKEVEISQGETLVTVSWCHDSGVTDPVDKIRGTWIKKMNKSWQHSSSLPSPTTLCLYFVPYLPHSSMPASFQVWKEDLPVSVHVFPPSLVCAVCWIGFTFSVHLGIKKSLSSSPILSNPSPTASTTTLSIDEYFNFNWCQWVHQWIGQKYICPLLHTCHGPPLHTDFKHRLHLHKPHYQISMASGCLPFTLLHLISHFCFILLFHILNLEPKFGSKQTSVRFHWTLTQIYLLIYIYRRITCRYSVQISTWFSQIFLWLQVHLSLSKSMASTLLDYFTLYPNLHSLQTLLHNPILGLWLKGDIANRFAKAHVLCRPPLVQVIFIYLACL